MHSGVGFNLRQIQQSKHGGISSENGELDDHGVLPGHRPFLPGRSGQAEPNALRQAGQVEEQAARQEERRPQAGPGLHPVALE